MARARGWVFTVNNDTADDRSKTIDTAQVAQCIVAEHEVGENGTPHIQGAVYFANPRTLGGVRRLIPRAHWEVMRGTWQQAREYCLKGDEADRIIDTGEPPHQGTRNDLVSFRDALKEGKSLIEMLDAFPVESIKYWRAMTAIQSLYFKHQGLSRGWVTTGLWLYGPTGVGKSHRAFEGFNIRTHYVHNVRDKGWWDGYDPENHHTVILNDFRSKHMDYEELLALVDKWHHTVSRRGREPAVFLAKHVIVTAPCRPEMLYPNRNAADSIAQLDRRFVIEEVVREPEAHD